MSDDADKAPAAASKASKMSKKGGKKTPAEDVKYQYGDIVLGRLRGFPAWPARITDPDDLPANVLAQRPKSTSFYCTQFFPVGDFSWLAPKDISPLKPHQIDAFINEPHRKVSGPLRQAYMTAQDPTEWDAQQQAKRRKLEEAEADEDVDELEEEEDNETTAGKRKRASAPKKDAKKAKTAKKAAAEPKPKADKKADKPKAEKATTGDEGGAEPTDPEAIRVKDWRHRLQRAFLGSELPTADKMEGFDELFTTLENYEKMTVDYLAYSKIGKVLKKIAALENIPRNDEFKLTDRAIKLMTKWQQIIHPGEESAQTNGTGAKSDGAEAADAPAAPAAEAEAEPEAAAAPAEEKEEA